MYSENQRRASISRANDEFLRRMIGGELTGGEMPVMNMETPSLPGRIGQGNGVLSGEENNYTGRERLSNEENNVGNGRPPYDDGMNNGSCRPSCDGSYDCENGNGDDCPTHIHAPSLAMVYAPRQCWRNLLDPQSALENGSLFAELIMPLEVVHNSRGMEVRGRK